MLAPSTLSTWRWRNREKAGRVLLRLEVDEAALVIGLVDRGLLDPAMAVTVMRHTAMPRRMTEFGSVCCCAL